MFNWFWTWLWPQDDVIVRVGDRFNVNNPDHARMVIVDLCARSGKIVMGEADWNQDGTGVVIVSAVCDVPNELE